MRRVSHRTATSAGTLVAGCLLLLAACGGGSAPAAPPSGGSTPAAASAPAASTQGPSPAPAPKTIKLTFGYNLNGGQTPSYVARTKGFFKQQGLDVTAVPFTNNANMIGAINSGSIQIMASIPSFPWGAREAGYDLVAIMQNETSHLTPPDSPALIVPTGSSIKTLKDLEGKKVACLALSSQDCLNLHYLMQQAGVDISKVQFVQAPFSSDYDLLRSGQVNAVETVDPFTTQIVTSGIGRVFQYTLLRTVPGQPLGAWWALRKWVQANPDTVTRFDAAMKAAIDWMHAHPNQARKAVGDFTHLPAAVLSKMPLLNWDYEVDPATWQKEAEVLVKEGALKRLPNPSNYFAPQIKPYFTDKNVQYYAAENAKLRPAAAQP